MVVDEWGIPDFGDTVCRAHLLDVFEGSKPGLVFVVAPSGYGKSVLASQMAASARFARAVWIDLSGLCGDSRAVLERLFASVERLADETQRLSLSLVSQPNEADMYSALESHFARDSLGPCCVVLDGLSSLSDADACVYLLNRIQKNSGGSCVVVTTREVTEAACSCDPAPWVVETPDLALTAEEAHSMLQMRGRSDMNREAATALNAACGGQAALLSVMAMHRTLDSGYRWARTSVDLRSHLLRVAIGQLAEEERELLFGAALLRSGNCTELDVLVGHPAAGMLRRVSEVIPLLHISETPVSSCVFRFHDNAADVYSLSPLGLSTDRTNQTKHRALERLNARGDYERFFLILERSSADELASGLELHGNKLLALGQGGLVRRLIDSLPVKTVAAHFALLLLNARLQRTAGCPRLALDSINAALALASEFDHGRAIAEARVLKARVLLDLSDTVAVVPCLRPLFDAPPDAISAELLALAEAYMGISLAHGGRIEEAKKYVASALALIDTKAIQGETRGYVLISSLWLSGPIQGDWATVARLLETAIVAPGISVSMRLHLQSNLVWALGQMGHLHRAERLNAELRQKSQESGTLWITSYADSNEAALLAGRARMSEALQLQNRVTRECRDNSDEFSAAWIQLSRAKWERALGRHDESLQQAEEALSYFSDEDGGSPTWVVRSKLEVAASRLALGETALAQSSVGHIVASLDILATPADALVADLVSAEASRRDNRFSSAVQSLTAHTEYILTESANWDLAMYIRAFPGLLGLVAAAVGVDRLPAHMLRMLMPEHARAALPLAREVLDDDAWRRLAVRLLGEDEAASLEATCGTEPLVHVRLFGGLEVVTPDGVVPDRAWRKRKARLLFMMLLVRQGRDVPRDVLLEHLWPDMDEERAKNNFYVIWSAMKRALLPSGRSAPCPYVEHVGGICRVVRPLVRSDLDDFDDALAGLAEAEAAGDLPSALSAIQRLREIYRADLLPSEVYDDWFRQLRERCRVQFGDAMLRVSSMCRAAGDSAQAVQLVRAGLEQDPWREDLYQIAMRCQIDTGQRSGAVDMFMACRSKLSEDLGLDPSVETRRLYDEVLAMEESPRD